MNANAVPANGPLVPIPARSVLGSLVSFTPERTEPRGQIGERMGRLQSGHQEHSDRFGDEIRNENADCHAHAENPGASRALKADPAEALRYE
jgi:hypothetical protein